MALDTPQEPREATGGSNMRERDEQRGIKNPQVEYKKQLEEEARKRYEERTRRRTMDPSGTKVPAQQTQPRVAPGSARVGRDRERLPGEIPEGTRPTVSEEFKQRQYGDRFTRKGTEQGEKRQQEEARAALADTGREAKRKKRRIRDKQKVRAKRPVRSSVWRRSRLFWATVIAVSACTPLWILQLYWSVIFLFGAGIEGGATTMAAIFGESNVATRLIGSIISTLLPGATLLAIGWIMVIIFGVLQIILTFVIYMLRRINPIASAGALVGLGISFVLQFSPVALLPWVVIWMYSIMKQEQQ